jgi:pyridoxal phosphate enzyme (YggS family)
MTTPDEIVSERLAQVLETIDDVGRDGVTIIAVTKGFDRSAIECAQRVGIHDVGENYAQELIEKADAVDENTAVHFMGRIQRNKVRKIADHVDLWHSVARPEILSEIAKRRPSPRVLIQVRPYGDESKDGVGPEALEEMLSVGEEQGVDVAGLMTIGVLGDPDATRASFIEVNRLADEYGLVERSMGMSGDYRDALSAGATMLRLGSVLFGDRPAK